MMAIPFVTRLGGICWMPRALRKSERTTTILTYDVTMIATNGARESIVISPIRAIGSLRLICTRMHLRHKDAQAVAHPHQPAGGEPRTVGADRHRPVRRGAQREDVPGADRPKPPDRLVTAAQLEPQLNAEVLRPPSRGP